MSLVIVACVSRNNVIADSKTPGMLWHIPAELKHFKKLTNNQNIIVGRKTAESMPYLKDRNVFVLSNSKNEVYDYTIISYHKLLHRLFTRNEFFLLCGGEQIYKLLIPFASNAIISKLHTDAIGDIYMPNFDGHWQTDNIQKCKEFDIWYSSRVQFAKC